MSSNSKIHFYFNWAKERLDEMDAALASLEAKTTQMNADAKVKAKQAIADLKKRRSEFENLANKQKEAGEASWQRARAQLETQWSDFQAKLKSYIETVGKQIKQQQQTFREVSAAQTKAWREAAEELRGEGAKMAAARRADIDALVKRMNSDAAETEKHFQKLKEAGDESWSAFSAALAESRKAFDRTNQAAWDAIKRARSSKP